MKVLYISGMYPTPTYPQKGIFCHEQVKALQQIGVEVDVIVPMTIYDREYTTKVWKYEGVKIRYLRYLKIPGVYHFENIGKHLYHALIQAKIDFTKYDVLHADTPLPAGDAAQRIAKRYGIPVIVHGHGLDVFMEESYANKRNCEKISEAVQLVYKRANAICGVSQKVLDQIQKKVEIRHKSYVVYNGVDVDKFRPLEHRNKCFTITSIGNLIPLKGHDYTIKAVKGLIDQGFTNLRLIIVGRGEQEKNLKELVHRLQMDDYVKFVGYIPYADIVKLLQKSDIFVLPSWYEALGCVYLEAMACGLPIIGCRGGGIEEIVSDGVNGYLVDEKNETQICDKIKTFMRYNKKLQIGKNARVLVESHYTWMHSAKMLKQIYGEVKNDTFES